LIRSVNVAKRTNTVTRSPRFTIPKNGVSFGSCHTATTKNNRVMGSRMANPSPGRNPRNHVANSTGTMKRAGNWMMGGVA